MPRVIETSHRHPVEADLPWSAAADRDALAEVDRGMVRRIGPPRGRFRKGRRLEIEVSGMRMPGLAA